MPPVSSCKIVLKIQKKRIRCENIKPQKYRRSESQRTELWDKPGDEMCQGQIRNPVPRGSLGVGATSPTSGNFRIRSSSSVDITTTEKPADDARRQRSPEQNRNDPVPVEPHLEHSV